MNISLNTAIKLVAECAYEQAVRSQPTHGYMLPQGIKFGYSAVYPDPDEFDFSHLIDLSYMFYHSTADGEFQDVPGYNTSSATSMAYMFRNNRIRTMAMLDTSKVTDMEGMFEGAYILGILPEFNTTNVRSMKKMFNSCHLLESVLMFDTSNVLDMSGMLSNCSTVTHVPELDTTNVTDMSNMFHEATQRLTEESINNILMMCAKSKHTPKTLASIGFDDYDCSIAITQPNWTYCIVAGWSTGH